MRGAIPAGVQDRLIGNHKTAPHWVSTAKRPETRERRLTLLIEDCAAGRGLGQFERGVVPGNTP
ncbi:YdeI/OmpD-associated family protein [Streptosporangium sp. NPDC050280]|uniref:YdeI/OmpD-associated family protein n=1 Tax=unclassified Streptosporangium TaxID=2632669 RepID=UPI00342F62F3